MHDAGAVVERDEVVDDDAPAVRERLVGGLRRPAPLEDRCVAEPLEPLGVEALQDLAATLAEDLLEHRLGQDVEVLAPLAALAGRTRDERVGRTRFDSQAGVGRERPRSGRPGEEEHGSFVVFGQQCAFHEGSRLGRELRVDRRILVVLLVAQRHLVRGEGRVRRRRMPGGLVVLDQQIAVPQLLEHPPARLDVVVRVGDVGVVQVEPEADPLGHLVPFLDVFEHVLAAERVELLDAVVLDLLLAFEAEALLDGDLDRQAVRVPAALPADAVPLHRLVAREQVLERACAHVVDARLPVRGGRTLVERPVPLGRRLVERPREHLGVAPAIDDAALEVGEVDGGRDGIEGGHGTSLWWGRGRWERAGAASPRGTTNAPRPGRCDRGAPESAMSTGLAGGEGAARGVGAWVRIGSGRRGTTQLRRRIAAATSEPPRRRRLWRRAANESRPARPEERRTGAVSGATRLRLRRRSERPSGSGSGRMSIGSRRRTRTVSGSLRRGTTEARGPVVACWRGCAPPSRLGRGVLYTGKPRCIYST